MQQKESAIRVFRPALLPDNRRLVWYPLTICGILAILGYFFNNLALAVIPLLGVAVFPGIPIAIHSVFFLGVKITLYEDTLIVVDWAGDPFVSYPRRQEMALSRVAYVYHLQKEAEANMTGTVPWAPFCNTYIKTKKYRAANANPRRAGAQARSDNGLVLSDKEGEDKVYIMHFHDLSKKDWQELARQIRKRKKDISFLMTDREKKGLLG
ncbi:MAG: hypothetical protein PVF99_03105 [Desulfobacterales bacterium]